MGLKNKKGMFFSIIVTSIIILILVSMNINYETDINLKNSYTLEYAKDLENFVIDTSNDFERAFYISFYRTILSANEYISQYQEFITRKDLLSLIVNGTIKNEKINLSANDNLNDWKKSILNLAENYKIDFDFEIIDFNIYQKDLWNLESSLLIVFNFTSENNKINYSFSKFFVTQINIIEFEDPFYNYFGNGRIFSTIYDSKYSFEEIFSNQTIFDEIILNKKYIANLDAPSFLNRLQGNFSSSEFGIMRIINLEDLDINMRINSSLADYIYWQGEVESYFLNNSDISWLRLDQENIDYYGLTKK